MPRPVQRQLPRTGRRHSVGSLPHSPRTPQAAVLGLQRLAGNHATADLIARTPKTAEQKPITAPGITGMQQYYLRAEAHFKAGRYEQAIADWAEAYRLHPISTFLRDQGEALERLKRFDEAAKMYERYLANGPLTADRAKYRSRIRKLRGEQIPPGEDDDEPEIKAVGREGAQAWFDRGQDAYVGKRYAKAAESFRHAHRLWANADFLFNEGSALEAGGHKRAAANAYEHYLVAGGTDRKVVERIKQLRAEAKPRGPDEVIDPEDEASEMPAVAGTGRKAASQWHDRGSVAWLVGDYMRAYQAFVSAYDAFPAPDFVHNQAASLDMAGNVDAAIQAYERYLLLAPKAKDVKRIRKRIALLRANSRGGNP